MQRRFDNSSINSSSTEALLSMKNLLWLQRWQKTQKSIFVTSAKLGFQDVFRVLTQHTQPLIIVLMVWNTYTRVSNYLFRRGPTIFLWTIAGVFYIQQEVTQPVGRTRLCSVSITPWQGLNQGRPYQIFLLLSRRHNCWRWNYSSEILGTWQMVDNDYVKIPVAISP